MVANSIKVAVLLAMHIAPDSTLGEMMPKEVFDLAREEGLIDMTGPLGDESYITEEGRRRLESAMRAFGMRSGQ